MSKKTPQEPMVHLPSIIKAVNGSKDYPVDFVRELYITSEKTLEELAIQLNLPVQEVELHARQGVQSWHKLKQDRIATRMQYFMDVNIDNLMETHSMLEDGHFLQIVQIKGTQEFLKQYYAKNGHLFLIRPDGEIAEDAFGMPIPLPLPNGPKQLLALDGLLKLKEGTKQALNHVYGQLKEKDKPTVLDIDNYGLFESEEKS